MYQNKKMHFSRDITSNCMNSTAEFISNLIEFYFSCGLIITKQVFGICPVECVKMGKVICLEESTISHVLNA